MIKKILGLFTFVLLGYSICFGDGGNGFCGNPVSEGLKFSLNMGDNIVQSDLNNSNLILKNHGNFYTDSDNFNGDYLYYKFLYNSTYYFTYIFFRSNNGLYWGDYNSQSNSYGTITRHQGYVNYLCEFDGLTDACYLNPGTTCNSNGISIVSSGNVYTNESYYNPDKVDFYWWGSSYPTICFRYTSRNLTLCATYNVGQNYNTNNLTYTEGNLLASTDPNNFNSNIFVNSPWGSPTEGGGSSSGNGTGISLECTKQNALNRYNKNGYDRRLCYGGYDDFVINDGTPLGYLPYWGTGLDFEEIWLETANLRQGGTTGSAIDLYPWFTYWRAMYDLYKRGGFDVNPFLNTPWVLFSYFGVIDIYGHTFLSKDIIEYCDLLLYTSDYSVGYSGSNVDNVCTRSNLLDDYNSNLSGDNLNIGIDIIGSGENITDGTDFINKYWAVLRQNFSNAVENTDGVLPLYIQLALIGLILFRFISH